MSPKEEIQEIVTKERVALESAENAQRDMERDILDRSRKLIDEIRPMLDGLLEGTSDLNVRFEFRENFAGTNDVTTIVCVGDVHISDNGSSSNVGWSNAGHWWSFWPCFAEDGRVSWSFCDGAAKHEWFESISDLFARLIPGVAKEIAKQQGNKTLGTKSHE